MSDQVNTSDPRYPRPWLDVSSSQPNLLKLLMNQSEMQFPEVDLANYDSNATFISLLKEASEHLDLFMENHIEEALRLCEKKASYSIYHRYGVGLMIGINAFFSLEPSAVNHAITELTKIIEFLDKRKDKTGGLFTNPNYEDISDEQAHAALCYTELNAVLAFLKPMSDKSFKGFLSSAFRLKSSYTGFKECLALYRKKPFADEESQEEFQTGVRMIYGVFGLFFSLLPAKFTSLLEYFGLFNNRYQGLDILKKCTQQKENLRYSVTSLFIFAYFSFLDYVFGLGEGDLNLLEDIVQDWYSKYPKSFYYQLMKGVATMNASKFEEACQIFHGTLSKPALSPHLYKISYFFMVLSKIQSCSWSEAATIMKLMVGDKVSPATSTYFYAILLFMDYDLNDEQSHKNEIIDLMRVIPSLKKTLGGRKPFHEKLVYERSVKFNGKLDKLFLPTFEISYIWNLFRMSRGSSRHLNQYMAIVDRKLKDFSAKDANADHYATLIFYKAHFSEILGNFFEAIDCYHEVLDCESRIVNEKHLLPQTYFELGHLFRKLGRYEDSEKYLTKSKNYRGYLTESMITYRVNLVFEQLRKINKVKRKLSSPYDRRKSSIIDPAMFNRPVSYS